MAKGSRRTPKKPPTQIRAEEIAATMGEPIPVEPSHIGSALAGVVERAGLTTADKLLGPRKRSPGEPFNEATHDSGIRLNHDEARVFFEFLKEPPTAAQQDRLKHYGFEKERNTDRVWNAPNQFTIRNVADRLWLEFAQKDISHGQVR